LNRTGLEAIIKGGFDAKFTKPLVTSIWMIFTEHARWCWDHYLEEHFR
ncbi:MAG: hypothetical protein ACI9AF_001935, partial [Granulosicoccus sp.]